ncbi:YceD family protein [Thermaerobacter litoralis]
MADPLVIDIEPLTRQRGLQSSGTVVAPIDPIPVPGGDIAAEGPVRLKYRLTHTGEGRIWLEADLAARARLTCDRCLEAFETELHTRYEEEFRPRPAGAGAEEEPDDAGETRVAYYDDHHVDLREGIRQNLILAVPAKQLCRLGCQGLCPRCGKNLNEGPCDCREEALDPRLAALDQWLREHGKGEEGDHGGSEA